MHKLTNLFVDVLGFSGKKAKADAKMNAVLKRSIVVISAFAAGVAAGTGVFALAPGLVDRGFASLMGLTYAGILLAHDLRGRLSATSLTVALSGAR